MSKVKILDHDKLVRKIDRIAWQVYENHAELNEIHIVGISGNGLKFASLLSEKLSQISNLNVCFYQLELDKNNPENDTIRISPDASMLNNQSVLIVDDVLNTGKTTMYAINEVIKFKPNSIRVAVVIDRDHKNFPVFADFVGLALSTNIQEHVLVDFSKDSYSVTLM
jgi:pyrimidine operon attenuation protein/uracil phosphoribosyltransferase